MYKMVQSNPDDEVDKVVLFGNNQQNNFATNEFNPMYGSGIDLKQVFGDKPGVDLIGTCLSYNAKLPDSFDAFKNDDKAKAFFVLLSRGDDVYDLRGADPDEPTDIYSDIYQLATDPDNASSEYENYLANYKNYFSLQNRGYRYTVN
jgi:hypothetical protein